IRTRNQKIFIHKFPTFILLNHWIKDFIQPESTIYVSGGVFPKNFPWNIAIIIPLFLRKFKFIPFQLIIVSRHSGEILSGQFLQTLISSFFRYCNIVGEHWVKLKIFHFDSINSPQPLNVEFSVMRHLLNVRIFKKLLQKLNDFLLLFLVKRRFRMIGGDSYPIIRTISQGNTSNFCSFKEGVQPSTLNIKAHPFSTHHALNLFPYFFKGFKISVFMLILFNISIQKIDQVL